MGSPTLSKHLRAIMPINFPFLGNFGLSIGSETPEPKKTFVQSLNLVDLSANLCVDDFKLCKDIYAEMNIDHLCSKMAKGNFIRHVLSNPLDKKPYIAIIAYLMNTKVLNPRVWKNLDVESIVLDLATRLEKLRNDIAMSEKGTGGFLRWYSSENDALFVAVAPTENNILFFELIFTFGEKSTNALIDSFTDAQTKCMRKMLGDL